MSTDMSTNPLDRQSVDPFTPNLTTLGDRIRARRLKLRISGRELARRSGVNHSQVWRIEHDRHDPSVGTLRKIATALDVEICSLLG